MPEIRPDDAFKLKPGASEPEVMLKVMVPVPPDVCICCEYVCPKVADGRLAVVILKAGQFTCKVYALSTC